MMRIFSVCMALTGVSMAFTAGAQYCVSGGPNSTIDSNVETVQITGVASSINHTGCPGVIGVQDLTAQSVTLSAGSSYHLYVKFGTCGGNYFGAGEAWIDFNKNGIFEATESLGNWNGTPPVTTSDFFFSVPVAASNGATRMRVTQQEGTTPPLNACASFSWGSVMDFTVIITGGASCTGYTGDYMADAIAVPSLPYLDTNNTSICYSSFSSVYPSPDVYYRVITSAGAYDIHATTCGSSFDTFISLLDKNGNVISYNDDSFSCGSSSELWYPVNGVDTFYVVVEGWNTSNGVYQLLIEQNSGLCVSRETKALPRIYPNPASDFIFIENVPDGTILYMYNATGAMVAKQVLQRNYRLDIHSYNPGYYFLNFRLPDGSSGSRKILIQRP